MSRQIIMGWAAVRWSPAPAHASRACTAAASPRGVGGLHRRLCGGLGLGVFGAAGQPRVVVQRAPPWASPGVWRGPAWARRAWW